VGRSYFLGGLLLVAWLAGLLSVLLWCYLTWQSGWRLTLGLLVVLGAGVAVRTGWNKTVSGQLTWNSEVWCWESASSPTERCEHELSVIADFQNRLLLHLENQAGVSLWLLVEQSALPERWLDLRRAVYSPHRSSGGLPSHDVLSVSPSLPSAAVAVSSAMLPLKPSPSSHES